MTKPRTDGVPKDLGRLLDEAGARISSSRPIDYGTQHRVERGPDAATVNVYTSGKALVQGKSSSLKTVLEGWRLARAGAGEPSRRAGDALGEPDSTPRVGTDEAGKGDYFGPLVVAGVRVLGKKEARGLREAGARDSKTMSASAAVETARRILDLLGPENVCVVSLPPEEYEARRRAAGDVNRLLAEVNVEIFGELEDEVEALVVDEFSKAARSYIAPGVPAGVRLVVRPRAESDVAVAAASVLARARYLEEMDALSGGVGFELPRGATHVVGAARRVMRERGSEGLAEVAKVHFATTKKVLGTAAAMGEGS